MKLVLVAVLVGLLMQVSSLWQKGSRVVRKFGALNMSTHRHAVHVKGALTPGSAEKFHLETLENAKNSILEVGVSRFDYLKRIDVESDDFLLVEVYRHEDAPAAHKETSHYNKWRTAVAESMAVPRAATKFRTLFPPPDHWLTSPAASKSTPEEMAKSMPWTVKEPFVSGGEKSDNISSPESGMLAVMVDIQCTPDDIPEFIDATLKNCQNSVKEGGVSRFDFLQDETDEGHFMLVEVYNDKGGPVAHKASTHYAAWAAKCNPMMARPRQASKYVTLFPAPLFWHESSEAIYSSSNKGLDYVPGNAFSFLSPKLTFGRGTAAKALTAGMKEAKISNPFIITGASGLSRLDAEIIAPVFGSGKVVTGQNHYGISGEPTVEQARQVTEMAKAAGSDGVVAIGGGSALDLAKAVSALVTNPGDVLDYVEVFGKGQAITEAPLPMLAIPTTAGTGSEVTKNAVLKSEEHNLKASMRHDTMLPVRAIVDPTLMVSCPPGVTAHVGLDTLCQNIEPYISNNANPITDALSKEGIVRAARSLRRAVSNGSDISAREDMAIASTLGGIALANSKLGTVHGFAGVLGGMFEYAPHGALCATLLPATFARTAERLVECAASGGSLGGIDAATAETRLERMREVSRLVTGSESADWPEGVAWLKAIVRDLKVPGLNALCKLDARGGMTAAEKDACLKATAGASSTKGNPIALSDADLREILEASL